MGNDKGGLQTFRIPHSTFAILPGYRREAVLFFVPRAGALALAFFLEDAVFVREVVRFAAAAGFLCEAWRLAGARRLAAGFFMSCIVASIFTSDFVSSRQT